MITVISGSRDIFSMSVLELAITEATSKYGFAITEVVAGEAVRGVDQLAKKWAERNGIKYTPMPADWDDLTALGAVPKFSEQYGKMYNANAGFFRNDAMAQYASWDTEGGACIAVWNAKSNGTSNMIKCAHKHKLKYIHVYKELDY
jgi:hypothetical protein